MLFVLVFAPVTSAQTAEEKKAILAFVESLRDKNTGAFKVIPDGKPTLRACNGAAKIIAILGGELTDKEKVQKFVLSCYDEKAGTFADPGTKADVASTAIGVIASCELGIPKAKLRAAIEYLGKNAKEFEDIRISAAAVEAWGAKECPFDVNNWKPVFVAYQLELIDSRYGYNGMPPIKGPYARELGSVAASYLRIGLRLPDTDEAFLEELDWGQLPDGGWGKRQAKTSDIESTYRAMRAYLMLKTLPKEVKKLREYLASHRNKDGGFSTEPGKPSSMSGAYYNITITKWLNEMSKK